MNLNLLPARTSRLLYFLFVGFFCLSLLYFISRGPLRAISLSTSCVDFTPVYLGSSLWLNGLNPYNHDDINRLWLKINEPTNNVDKITDARPAVYPIPVFPLIAPLTFLKLSLAQSVWAGINFLVFLGAILSSISLSKFKILEKDAIFICCLALSLNPIHYGIKEGNPSVLAGSLMVISLWAADRDQSVLGGILFALSLCLKVNIAIIFILYFILLKKYKLLLISILTLTLIIIIAVMPFGLNFEWFYSWRSNVNAAFSGGINDPNLAKSIIGYLNLDYVAIKIIHSKLIIKIIVLLMLFGYLSILFKYYKSMKYNHQNLLLLSYIAIINMLLMPYQRSFNAAILILPIALAFLLRKNKLIVYGNTLIILIIPFLFPLSATIDYVLQKYNYYWLINSPYFNCLIIGHRTWLLLIMSIIMIRVMNLDYHRSPIRD